MIVFDGKTPPAKNGTSAARRAKREHAESLLSAATTEGERTKLVQQCVGLDGRIIARVSQAISSTCNIETITAPYEADAKLVFLEGQLCPRYDRCFIHATGSDLVVLGAKNLAWNITRGGSFNDLYADVICRRTLLDPPPDIFADDSRGSFLRTLHGNPDNSPSDIRRGLQLDEADRRLLNFALIAGNDYHRYRSIREKSASKIALPPLEGIPEATDAAAELENIARLVSPAGGVSDSTRHTLAESTLMFRNSVVFDAFTGKQRRQHDLPSGGAEAEARASLSTGACSP